MIDNNTCLANSLTGTYEHIGCRKIDMLFWILRSNTCRTSHHMNRKIPNGAGALIVGGLLVAFACWAYFGDTSLRQGRRMALARAHLPAITNAVFARPEFRDVRVGVGTGAGGCFLIVGIVETEQNLSDLQHVIAAQQPPVRVVYQLKVLERYSDAKPQFNSKPAVKGL